MVKHGWKKVDNGAKKCIPGTKLIHFHFNCNGIKKTITVIIIIMMKNNSPFRIEAESNQHCHRIFENNMA